MTDDPYAALLINLGDGQTIFCHIRDTKCSVCGTAIDHIPAMLLYRPPRDGYELVCRDCALVIMSAARVRIVDPYYNG